jgi:hypothetical protein
MTGVFGVPARSAPGLRLELAGLRPRPAGLRPGFAALIAAGVVVMLLNRNAVLSWPDQVAADGADWLLGIGGSSHAPSVRRQGGRSCRTVIRRPWASCAPSPMPQSTEGGGGIDPTRECRHRGRTEAHTPFASAKWVRCIPYTSHRPPTRPRYDRDLDAARFPPGESDEQADGFRLRWASSASHAHRPAEASCYEVS